MRKARILIVDDEPDMLESCQEILQSEAVDVTTETKSPAAAKRMEIERYDLLMTDLKMPVMDGLSLIEYARKASPETIVVLLTGFPTVETAVEAVKKGAFDYITKPFSPDQLRVAVKRALTQKYLKEENSFLGREIERTARFDNMTGKNPKMLKLFQMIEQVSRAGSDVLIVGESGVGKELVARSLHIRGKRKGKRFVPVDCGAIPENLLENELFGHERGAFTGAQSSSPGLLEFAHEGMLFLDEICELHPSLQAKLLRVLQERQFRRVGGQETRSINVQVIAATNRDIDLEVREKRFREDLFYRVNVVRLIVPPLRERADDIPLLATHFFERYGKEWGREIRGIEKEAMEVLSHYRWPGNVRELQNVIKRAVVFCRENQVATDDLPAEVFEMGNTGTFLSEDSGFFTMRSKKMEEFESDYFKSLLARHKGDVSKAAEEAGLPKGSLYRLIKKHGFKPETFR